MFLKTQNYLLYIKQNIYDRYKLFRFNGGQRL